MTVFAVMVKQLAVSIDVGSSPTLAPFNFYTAKGENKNESYIKHANKGN